MEMKIKAVAPWFGGKRTLAPAIVEQLGNHGQYFEPFCGSMAVLFAKQPSQKETVNDLHGDLTNLARCLQQEQIALRLYQRTYSTLFSEGVLTDARSVLEQEFDFQELDPEKMLERAYWYFIGTWMGRNGTAGTKRLDYQVAVRWTKGGGSTTTRWENVVSSIPAWHKRLKKVVILQRDALRIIDRFEDCDATAIYVDPPYYSATRSGHDKNGNSSYLHEFDHGEDHEFRSGVFGDMCSICGKGKAAHRSHHTRLAEILNRYKNARIVVSYYDHPRIREWYQGWTFLEKTMNKQLHAQNGRGARKQEAKEVLIINGEAY